MLLIRVLQNPSVLAYGVSRPQSNTLPFSCCTFLVLGSDRTDFTTLWSGLWKSCLVLISKNLSNWMFICL